MSNPFEEFFRIATAGVRSSDESQARRLRQSTAELRAAMESMFGETVGATDEQGYVEAVVDLRGRLQEMRISAYAMRDLDAPHLSDACLRAYRAAKAAAATVIAERFSDLLGVQPGAASFEDAIPPGMRSWPEVDEIRRQMR